jgi:hypothetical protein
MPWLPDYYNSMQFNGVTGDAKHLKLEESSKHLAEGAKAMAEGAKAMAEGFSTGSKAVVAVAFIWGGVRMYQTYCGQLQNHKHDHWGGNKNGTETPKSFLILSLTRKYSTPFGSRARQNYCALIA